MIQSGQTKINPKVKDVLRLLGGGTLLLALVVIPPLAMGIKPILDIYEAYETRGRQKDFKEWERFNLWRLREVLKRLKKQKVVEIVEENGEPVVILTKKGRTRCLKYKLEEMVIERPPKWDGKWRLVIYDIAKYKKNVQEAFRRTLKRLKFFRLQKSVYLYPYPCQDEIEFLRQFYGIGDEVIILTVEGPEEEEAYKKYFGL